MRWLSKVWEGFPGATTVFDLGAEFFLSFSSQWETESERISYLVRSYASIIPTVQRNLTILARNGMAQTVRAHTCAMHFILGSSPTNACMCASMWIKKGLVAILDIKSWVGVTPEVNLRNLLQEAHKQGIHPELLNPGQTSPEVQKRGISGWLHKKDWCPPKII